MWNDLIFFNEADKDEKDKEDSKKEEKEDDDKKDEKKDKEDSKKEEKDDDDYNDLISDKDDDISDDDIEDSDIDDDIEDDDDETSYNNFVDDDIEVDDDKTSEDSGSDYNTLVVVNPSDGGGDESGDVFDKAAKAGYTYTVISNNMKHIHLNASGRKFNEIHNLGEDYYNHFSSVADMLFELASESPLIKLDNPTRSKEHCEDIDVESSDNYDFMSAIQAFISNMDYAKKVILEVRRSAEPSRPDIQSTMDEELTYLNKQVNYFMRKRLSSTSSMDESFNMLF